MTRAPLSALVAAAILAAAVPRAAADIWPPHVPDRTETLMRAADRAAFRTLNAAGMNELMRDVQQLALQAADAYEKAAEADPNNAEAHYRAAEILYAFFVSDIPHPERKVTMRAVTHWRRFEELAPLDDRLQSVYFRRAIALTKLAQDDTLRQAVVDYRRQLGLLAPGDQGLQLVLSNAAEAYMFIGELDEAIDHYLMALDLSKDALYGYGLAVALDRNGQHQRALDTVRQHGGSATQMMDTLHKDSVFFVPEGDIEYYKALGYEALGDYEMARKHYELFLEALPHSRYAVEARRNLKGIAGKKSTRRRGGSLWVF